MEPEEIVRCFSETLQNDPSISEAVAAVQTLLEVIQRSNAGLLSELDTELKAAIEKLTSSDRESQITAVTSGCKLFLRFITLCKLEEDFSIIKKSLLERGQQFLRNASVARSKIARLGNPFITDGVTVLTHSRSRVVLQLLTEAAKTNKWFKVYVTESLPDRAGDRMCKDLREADIDAVLILDSAVGYVMEKIDLVLVGAEGVVESGGIINKIGTCTMAICAKEMHKPVYAVAESFKFTRIFPLNQDDVPREFKYRTSKLTGDADLTREHPMVDYTPPAYLTLLFTDLGILTPSAVSDELIKLYL